jgi:hypothetical protein
MNLLRILRPLGIFYFSKWLGGVFRNISNEHEAKVKKLEKMVIEISEELQKDTNFISRVDAMTGPEGITRELIEKVIKMPEVKAQLAKYQNDKDISSSELENAFKEVLFASANGKSTHT